MGTYFKIVEKGISEGSLRIRFKCKSCGTIYKKSKDVKSCCKQWEDG